jgi:hypothetical protein
MTDFPELWFQQAPAPIGTLAVPGYSPPIAAQFIIIATAALRAPRRPLVQVPRVLTAYHEAGHALTLHATGRKVFRCVIEGGSGYAKFTPRWHVGPDSNPRDDADAAINAVSGPAAELLFAREFSIDSFREVAAGQIIGAGIAAKTGKPFLTVMGETYAAAAGLLDRHAGAVKAIAARLLRERHVEQGDLENIFARWGVNEH